VDTLPAPWQARLSGVSDISGVSARLEHVVMEQALRVLRSGAPDMVRAFAYLVLRERDLRAIRAVLRGHKLGLAGSDIRQALQRHPAEVN